MGTTTNLPSTRVSTTSPVGRSMAMRSSATGASLASRAARSVMPEAVCATVNCATTAPRPSTTHTACSHAAQSRPTKYCMGTLLVERRPPTREGPAERSSTGAPRRASRGATSCCRSRSPGLSEAAGLIVAVKRLATEAVLGEAPEELSFTVGDLDRRVNFLAPTTGGCTDELFDGRGGAGLLEPGLQPVQVHFVLNAPANC